MPFKKNTCCQQCVNGRKFDARWLTKEINSPYASHAFLIKKDPDCWLETQNRVLSQNRHSAKCHLR